MATLCKNCGFQNPPGMRFCGNCGSRLAGGPPPTGASAAGDSGSIREMGTLIGADLAERLRRSGVEAAGQRRNVTVMFTDLTGFTALAGRMDSEDVYDLIQQYMRLLINNVYKYEGIVDKLTGDGLMALFGAPISHENNAERAVLAALDMQAEIHTLNQSLKQEIGVDLSMRVGLHSGTVVVGGIGSDLLMDYTAIGDTVNLAHRIEEAAPPGAILISAAVYHQVRVLFDCQQVSVLNLKGIANPVEAYRVIGAREKPGSVRGVEGLRAPMVGRDRELGRLHEALQNLLEHKIGQFVVVTGEAGLGKSRLKAEFKAALDPSRVRALEGQSLAYRRSVAYWIFSALFHDYLGLSPSTPAARVRERLAEFVYNRLGSQAGDVLPYLEHMLSLPYSDPAAGERMRYLDAEQLRQQIFLAVRDLLVVDSYRQPLLLILEDLHWADEASLELIRFLLESVSKAPIFILAIARKVEAGPLAQALVWAEKHLGSSFQAIALQQLPLDQSEELLFQLLSIPALPRDMREQILHRSAGIPFYLEEILRMLIDRGALQYAQDRWRVIPGADIASLGVPSSLQELILARFDRLSIEQRRILQVAAVIGKDFELPVLSEVLRDSRAAELQASLRVLEEREFIRLLEGEDRPSYTFRHILMSDAIYDTLLRRERSKLHGQVGEVIETLYSDRLDSQVELLANHFRLSPNRQKALHYLILSGNKAARYHLNAQARQQFEFALETLDQAEPAPLQVYQVYSGLGDALAFAGEYPEARDRYLAALEALEPLDREAYLEERSSANRRIARTFERKGDYEMAVQYLDKARQNLDRAAGSLPVERARVWNDLGWIFFRQGNFTEAQRLLERGMRLVEDTGAYDTIASIYNRLGAISYNQGDWDTVALYLRKSISIRESIRDLTGLAASLSNLGYLEIEMGEFDQALENLTRSYEIRKRYGHIEGVAVALTNLGWLRTQRGELDEARQALQEALDLTRQIDYALLSNQVQKNLGELYLAEEDWPRATQVLTGIIPSLIDLNTQDQLLDTYRLLGETSLGAGDYPAAVEWGEKAEELLARLDEEADLTAVQRGELRRFLSMLARRSADWQTAARYLDESRVIFQQLRSPYYQGKVLYQFGLLFEDQGEAAKARPYYREAAGIFQKIGARLEVRRAETALLGIAAG